MAGATGIVFRFALNLDLMLLFGTPAFVLYALPPRSLGAVPEESGRILPLRWLVLVGAGLGLALSALGIVILAAAMSGVASTAVDWATVRMVITGTATGTAWLVRMSALLLIMGLATTRDVERGLVPIVLAAAVALASMAWLGHGVMDDGRTGAIHLTADIAHLLAAGGWVGALAGLLMLQARADSSVLVLRALICFGTAGSIIVALIVSSGLVNAWLLVGPAKIWSLATTLYGQLLLLKLALFVAMLGIAATNRFRLTPALDAAMTNDASDAACRALQRSITVETGCAVSILALVAWLGTLAPPASTM